MRDSLNIPAPRILGYSATSDNDVGAEYIIEETAPGRPLSTVWYGWSEESQISFVSQLVELEVRMTAVSFRSHGSLYFKRDLMQHGTPTPGLQEPLLAPPLPTPLHTSIDEYLIGPATTATSWKAECATMTDLNRGPCE